MPSRWEIAVLVALRDLVRLHDCMETAVVNGDVTATSACSRLVPAVWQAARDALAAVDEEEQI
jgi:hypothetical protein